MRALGLLVLLGPAVVLAAAPASPPATPGECSGEAEGTSRCVYFDPDGRLSFTWLRGQERTPVSERVSVPSVPHS